MDLHVIGPLPSPAERAAVDAVLGPPVSGWAGGTRDSSIDGHVAHGGHAAREMRDQLLPALHAVQARVGWISQPALSYISRRLTVPPAEAWGVATFYALLATQPRPPAVAHVCDDIACRLAGAETLCDDLARSLGPSAEPARDDSLMWQRSPCLGLCDRAPAALLVKAGEEAVAFGLGPTDAAGVIGRLEQATGRGPAAAADAVAPLPQAGSPELRLLARVGVVDPASLADYRSHGGMRALERALRIGREATTADVTAARLVGRGGAAFPTGRKWAAVAAQPAQPHFVVCNADESEPGTFKDRVLLEGDPFAIVEAMTIEAFAVGAERGYCYIRGEYPLAEERVRAAIDAARAGGYLGEDILGSGHRFDIEVRRGAGAYICGEETALFGSIEGRRGEPRNKPPFPVEVGLFGKPTAVNNVETLANVLLILAEDGAAARYAAIGTEGSAGPKLFCLSGHVARPGIYEVDFGLSLRQLLELAGGVPGGRTIQAILLGGAAGSFVGPDALDVPLTFEGTRAIGASLGSGVVMVFDETADLPGTLRRIATFFRDESCGQCVPCRVGTVRQEEVLERLTEHAHAALDGDGAHGSSSPSQGRLADLQLLRDVGLVMRDASICGLGQTASSAIESALRLPGMLAP